MPSSHGNKGTDASVAELESYHGLESAAEEAPLRLDTDGRQPTIGYSAAWDVPEIPSYMHAGSNSEATNIDRHGVEGNDVSSTTSFGNVHVTLMESQASMPLTHAQGRDEPINGNSERHTDAHIGSGGRKTEFPHDQGEAKIGRDASGLGSLRQSSKTPVGDEGEPRRRKYSLPPHGMVEPLSESRGLTQDEKPEAMAGKS